MENGIGLRDLAQLIAPNATIETLSTPEPALAEYNVLAVYDSEGASRDAVLALETIEGDDSSLGLVDFGSEQPQQETRPADARITAEALRPAAKGAVMGAVAAALLVGLSTMVLGAGDLAAAAAAGGALFGAFIGGTWGAFMRFGGSSAFRQSFSTTPSAPTLVSLHTNDVDKARTAVELLQPRADDGPEVVRMAPEGLQLVTL